MENNGSETRRMLIKRLLAICPQCQKQIYGGDINLSSIDRNKIRRWPLPYVYCHSHNNGPVHAITMYLDASFTVRAKEVSDYLTIQQ